MPLPSALSGVPEMLQDAGLRPRGKPRGEEQLLLWQLPIDCPNTRQQPRPPAGETEGKCGWNRRGASSANQASCLPRWPDVLERKKGVVLEEAAGSF